MWKRILAILLVLLMAVPMLPGCKKKGGSEEPGEVSETAAGSGEEEHVFSADFSFYEQSFLPDIVREVTAEDTVRNQPYVVDDAKLEELIDTLDFALNSKEIKGTLGLDIGKILNDVVGKIYTDDIVNLAVQYLYPLVEKEFAKVWAGLP